MRSCKIDWRQAAGSQANNDDALALCSLELTFDVYSMLRVQPLQHQARPSCWHADLAF